MIEYACSDADATYRSWRPLYNMLKAEGLKDYFESPMMSLSRYLLLSGLRGMKVDRKQLRRLSNELGVIVHELEERVGELAGRELNLRSPKDRKWLLYQHLGIPTDEVPRTMGGALSTAKPVLLSLYEQYRHPVLHYLVEHSEAGKLQSTYVHPGMTKWMDAVDRVHTTFRIAGAVTGRVTSSEPPIATIPRDKEYSFLSEPKMISLRDVFITDPGWEMTYADVSQAELAVALLVSGDQAIEILKEGRDFHNEVAWSCLGVPRGEKPDKQKRVLSKNIVFGRLLYGGSNEGVAAQAGCDPALVQQAYTSFARLCPNLVRFLDGVAEVAVTEKQLITPFGRIRRFMGDTRDNRTAGEIRRQGRNLYAQNGAAEVVFRALIRICDRFIHHKMKAWPINMVYDSIVTEHPISERKAVREIMVEEMTRPVVELDNYRFAIDVGQAHCWGEAERTAEKYYPYKEAHT
jgi:DNA polymerase-1